MLPGTANTSRPSSMASRAVISAPDRAAASTTTTARARPERILIAFGKVMASRRRAGWILGDERPLFGEFFGQLSMFGGIDAVGAGAPHRPTRPPGGEGPAVRRLIDATRHARYHHDAGFPKLFTKQARDLEAIGGRFARTDNSDRRQIVEATTYEEAQGWVGGGREQSRPLVVAGDQPTPSCRRDALDGGFCLGACKLYRRIEKSPRRTAVREAGKERFPGHFRDQPPDSRPSTSEHQTEPEEPFLDVIHRTHGTRAVPVILRAWIFGFLGALGATVPSAG